MLSLLVSTTALVAKPNALRLRGGLADVDPTMVANGALALTGLNAAVIALSPAKAGEIYEVSLSGADEAIVKYMGLTLLGQAMMIYYSMQGESAATAIGYSILPQLIGNLQGNLNDEPGKLFGQEGPAKYINIVLAAFMAHTLLGSPLPLPQVDSGTAINAYAAWGALNGLGMYFATDKLMEAWGASGAKIQKTYTPEYAKHLVRHIQKVARAAEKAGRDKVLALAEQKEDTDRMLEKLKVSRGLPCCNHCFTYDSRSSFSRTCYNYFFVVATTTKFSAAVHKIKKKLTN